MSKICLLRHGETEWNRLGKLQGREDIELNDTGRKQVRAVGKFLSTDQWHYVISSPLLRASQSAKIIGEELGISEIHILRDLIERDYGDASGMTTSERLDKYPNRNYPDQEEWSVLRDRFYNCVKNFIEKHRGKNIIAVSHSATINSLLFYLSEGKCGSGITKMCSASVSLLIHEDDEFTIEYFNKKVY